MTGVELSTLIDEVNGGATIGTTFKTQLANLAKALVEQRRPWMILRDTDTSKTVTTSNTWQTAIDLSTITRFSRFYGDFPVKLFDGSQTVFEYRQVPRNERLDHITDPSSFVFDEINLRLYLSGTPPFAGTLYIDHLKDTADIDLSSNSSIWSFPSWSHPLIAFLANGIYKGGVDFDDVNARMSPENRAQAEQIVKMLENWDNEKQLIAVQNTDPYGPGGGYRPNAIDMNA